MLSTRGSLSKLTAKFGNRDSSARGTRLPVDTLRAASFDDPDGPKFQGIDTAVAEFKSTHPYLLFNRQGTVLIRERAFRNSKLLSRLDQSLREGISSGGRDDLRTGLKRRSRRLLHFSFLALIGDKPTREHALRAARGALSAFAAETSWKPRPVIKSFLDCAETAVAVSLAYDWLYQELAGAERKMVEQALLRQVIEPAPCRVQRPVRALAEAAGQLYAGLEFRHTDSSACRA